MKHLVLFGLMVTMTIPEWVKAHEGHSHQPPKAGVPATSSLYHSRSKWRDATGMDFKLTDLRGQQVVLTMAYSSCTLTCPTILAKLKEIEKAALAKKAKGFKIVLASFDPTRDSPENLAKFHKSKKLSERWILLSPRSDSDVRELAALTGITYIRDKGGEYSHSNVIHVLDSEGVIEATLNGVAADATPIVEFLD